MDNAAARRPAWIMAPILAAILAAALGGRAAAHRPTGRHETWPGTWPPRPKRRGPRLRRRRGPGCGRGGGDRTRRHRPRRLGADHSRARERPRRSSRPRRGRRRRARPASGPVDARALSADSGVRVAGDAGGEPAGLYRSSLEGRGGGGPARVRKRVLERHRGRGPAAARGRGAGGLAIDPTLYRRFAVARVPVVVALDRPPPPCRVRHCDGEPVPDHDRVAGDVTLSRPAAVRRWRRSGGGDGADGARPLEASGGDGR